MAAWLTTGVMLLTLEAMHQVERLVLRRSGRSK
jgi:hypothetical protein